jgi:hypothetical protein
MAAVPKDFNWPRFPIGGMADIPFKNFTGSAFTPGQVVKLDTGNPWSPTNMVAGMVLTSAVTDWADGVIVQDTPVNNTGTIQIEGVTTVYQDSGGNPAAGAILGPSAAVAGAVTTYTGGDAKVGKAWSAGTATADPIGVRLTLVAGT